MDCRFERETGGSSWAGRWCLAIQLLQIMPLLSRLGLKFGGTFAHEESFGERRASIRQVVTRQVMT